MLYKIANSIQTKWIRGKHVIELYPGFGLLSLRLMKKGIGWTRCEIQILESFNSIELDSIFIINKTTPL